MTGFEVTFAPEVATFAQSAQSDSARPSSSDSWTHVTSPIPDATNPRQDHQLDSSIANHPSKRSRNERSRLSLSLFKRGSTAEHQTSRHTRGGALNGSIDRDADAIATRSEDKLHKYFGIPQSQYRHMSPSPDNDAQQRNPSIQASMELDRPGTQQSYGSEDTNYHGKVGSVKKRFSLLGIGKKPSKSSVNSRGGVESLTEE
jgi:dedicator of cytokinesis protein 3